MKKVDRFSDLKTLFTRLKPAEREQCLNALSSPQTSGNIEFAPVAQLIKMMAEHAEADRSQILKHAGIAQQAPATLNEIYLSARDFILEQLIADEQLTRPLLYSNRFRIMATNSKKLVQAQVLLSRGLKTQGLKLLEDVSTKAEKYEIFEQAIESQNIMRYLFASDGSSRSYEKLEKSILENRIRLDRVSAANALQARMQLLSYGSEKRGLQEVKAAAEQLAKSNKTAPLGMVAYTIETIQINLAKMQGDFKSASARSEHLIETLGSFPAIQSKERTMHVLLDIAGFHLRLGNLKKAEEASLAVEQGTRKNSFENYLSKKYLILIGMRAADRQPLRANLNKLLKSEYTMRRAHAAAYFNYYLAVLDYLDNDVDKALRILTSEAKINTQAGSEIQFGMQYMMYLCGVEMLLGQQGNAKKTIDSALESILRILRDGSRGSREKSIARLMVKLKKMNYNFPAVMKASQPMVTKLKSAEGPLAWNSLSYEVVPFHNWLEQKSTTKSPKPPRKPRTKKAAISASTSKPRVAKRAYNRKK